MVLRCSVFFHCSVKRFRLQLKMAAQFDHPPQLSLLSLAMSKEKEHNGFGETSPIQVIEEGEDAIDEKKLLRKLDWHLVPGLTVLFLLSFLDRSNGSSSLSLSLSFLHLTFLSVGNARIEGLAADTHMSASPFNGHNPHVSYCSLKCKPETSTSLH